MHFTDGETGVQHEDTSQVSQVTELENVQPGSVHTPMPELEENSGSLAYANFSVKITAGKVSLTQIWVLPEAGCVGMDMARRATQGLAFLTAGSLCFSQSLKCTFSH